MSDRQHPRDLPPADEAHASGKRSAETESTNARSAAAAQQKRSSDARTATTNPVAGRDLRACLADMTMSRFAAVKHQRTVVLERTVVLAKDMNAAADEIVKVRSRARREKLDPAEVRQELQIREKFGLLEDARHCTTSPDGSPLL